MAKHKKGIYVFELKVGEPADAAFTQIREGRRVRPLHVTGRIRDRAAGDQRTSRRKGKSGRPSKAR